MMQYKKLFDCAKDQEQAAAAQLAADASGGTRSVGDRRDGRVYVYNEKIEMAVNVALVTNRPLLVRGPSGSGKSSLARNVACLLNWRYYEHVITSRTQARDLLWTFDALKRLKDATANTLRPEHHYVEPGVLWWALDPATARVRGFEGEAENPAFDPGEGNGSEGAVVLLDEIDKADPDVPNNLLVPLGSYQFTVSETGRQVKPARPVLVVITTNDERMLPAAFMRRCVVIELDPPDEQLLVRIAEKHLGEDEKKIYKAVAERVVKISNDASAQGRQSATARQGPSTAEYLDTVRACIDLDIKPDDGHEWQALTSATLLKRQGQQ